VVCSGSIRKPPNRENVQSMHIMCMDKWWVCVVCSAVVCVYGGVGWHSRPLAHNRKKQHDAMDENSNGAAHIPNHRPHTHNINQSSPVLSLQHPWSSVTTPYHPHPTTRLKPPCTQTDESCKRQSTDTATASKVVWKCRKENTSM